MSPYTLVWYYEQDSETCIDFVSAPTAQGAVEAEAVHRPGAALIAVFQGHPKEKRIRFPI